MRLTALLAGILLIATGCSTNKADTAAADSGHNKTLIAYFSATGTTAKVAEAMAEATDATLYAITPESTYTEADLNWRDSLSRSSVEMADSLSRPALGGDSIDVAQYDVVFLGYPIWWNLAPRVVNTWIESQPALKGKKVYPFATSGSSTIDNSVDNLRTLYPQIDWQTGRLCNDGPEAAAKWATSIK